MNTSKLSLPLLFALLVCSGPGHADSVAQLLKNVLPASCNFSSDFVQNKTISAIPKPISSSGQLLFSCNHGLIWQTQQPITDILIYNHRNIQLKSIDGSRYLTLNDIRHQQIAKLLISLMQADTETLLADFIVEDLSQVPATSLSLTPKNAMAKKSIDTIVLTKDPQTDMLEIVINNANRQTIQLLINNNQTYANLNREQYSHTCKNTLALPKACDVILNPDFYSAGTP